MVNGRKQGLDGRNRYVACLELGIDPPMERKFLDNEAEVKDFIIRRNVHRRHLTRELRQELLGDLRAEGRSTRQIAGTLGVSQSTVVNDLKAGEQNCSPEGADPSTHKPTGEQNCSPEPTKSTAKSGDKPKTVTGKDGKAYPAAKPPVPNRPKSGKPMFVEGKVTDAFKKLVRLLGDRKDAFGKHEEHEKCLTALNVALAAYNRWQKATT
jgi:hypothetical protein